MQHKSQTLLFKLFAKLMELGKTQSNHDFNEMLRVQHIKQGYRLHEIISIQRYTDIENCKHFNQNISNKPLRFNGFFIFMFYVLMMPYGVLG